MTFPDFAKVIAALPSDDAEWGPRNTAPEGVPAILNNAPYAPYSKGDKLGRMADWTTDAGKDGRDGQRGGRQAYNRNFRGL